MIELGGDQVPYEHTIDLPTEVLTEQSATGQIIAISISDAAKMKTLIKIPAS